MTTLGQPRAQVSSAAPPASPPRVEFFRHSLTAADADEVAAVLRSLFLTTGPVCARAEARLAAFTGLDHILTVNSCTAALILALRGLGIGPGDEVVTTPLTFVATANAILHAGARLVFADVEPQTGLLDVDAALAAVGPRTRAILPVHLYGQMVDMRRLAAGASARGLAIVEDCAHALEAHRDGLRPGEASAAACYSFYATKNLTCGEGGAIGCRDAALAERLRQFRAGGLTRSAAQRHGGNYQHWDMEVLGYKANLSDIQAALLVHQIDRLEAQLTRREAIAHRYQQALADVPGIELPRLAGSGRSARHLFTIWTPPEHRDRALAELSARGIGVTVNYRAIHLLSYFRRELGLGPGAFPAAEQIGARTISLPLYPALGDDEVQRVIEAVADVARIWN